MPRRKNDTIIPPIFSWILTHHSVVSDWFPGHLMPISVFQLPPSPPLSWWEENDAGAGEIKHFQGSKFPKGSLLFKAPGGSSGARWMAWTTPPLVRSHFPFMAGCCGYQIDAHIWNCIYLSLYPSHVFK